MIHLLCPEITSASRDRTCSSYRDCDGLPQTGCEVDVNHDPEHCGGCHATACATANGAPGCSAGQCATGSCKEGFGDCNGDPGDGCEADVTSDPKNCQACGNSCDGGMCGGGLCK